jgi:hypothetical protein
MVVVSRAFIVTLFEGICRTQLHSPVGQIVNKIQVETREIVIGSGGWAVFRTHDSILRVPVSQEPTAVTPFFNKFVVVDSGGIRVITYEHRDESVSHHVADDPEVEAESTITFKGTPDRDKGIVVRMTPNPQLVSKIGWEQVGRDTSAAARVRKETGISNIASSY